MEHLNFIKDVNVSNTFKEILRCEYNRLLVKKGVRPVLRLKGYLTSWFNNRNRAIWTASILAFVIRVGTSFALETYKFNSTRDHWAFGHEWGRIAKWIVENKMFSLVDGSTPATITDPLYAFLIAAFFYMFGTFTTSAAIALILFQSFVCALSTWAIFVLAEKLYGPFEARLSSLLFACYPASIFFAVGRIAPSSLSILLLCLIFLVVLALPDSPRLRLAVLGGFLMGLLVLTSSTPLSLFLVIPLWLFLVGKEQRARMIVIALIFIGSATLVLVPWSVRNSITHGQASFTKTGLGMVLWLGNNPAANGYRDKFPAGTRFDSEAPYLQMAVSWIAGNPQEFVILTLKRIKYFWYQIPGRFSGGGVGLLQAWIFMPVLGLALWGAVWPGEKFERVGLLLLFFAIFPILFYVTFVPYYRHRFHIEPFVLILSSAGLHRFRAML